MKQNTVQGSETGMANPSQDPSTMRREIEELRKRLAALEEAVPGYVSSHPVPRKGKFRAIADRVSLPTTIAVLAVLLCAAIVYGQDVVNALFVSKDGNVGIGTMNPHAKLHVYEGGSSVEAWKGRAVFGGESNAVIATEIDNVALVGAHNKDLTAWAPLWLNTRNTSEKSGGDVIMGVGKGRLGIGTASPRSPLDIAAPTSFLPNDWISLSAGPIGSNTVVIGSLKSKATIGAHNSEFSSWTNLAINPGGNVEIGGDVKVGGALEVAGGPVSMIGERVAYGVDEGTPEKDSDLVELTAESDGFVVASLEFVKNNAICWIQGSVNDMRLASASINGVAVVDYPLYRSSFTMPVRKGEKWKVSFGKAAEHSAPQRYSIYWIPLGK